MYGWCFGEVFFIKEITDLRGTGKLNEGQNHFKLLKIFPFITFYNQFDKILAWQPVRKLNVATCFLSWTQWTTGGGRYLWYDLKAAFVRSHHTSEAHVHLPARWTSPVISHQLSGAPTCMFSTAGATLAQPALHHVEPGTATSTCKVTHASQWPLSLPSSNQRSTNLSGVSWPSIKSYQQTRNTWRRVCVCVCGRVQGCGGVCGGVWAGGGVCVYMLLRSSGLHSTHIVTWHTHTHTRKKTWQLL